MAKSQNTAPTRSDLIARAIADAEQITQPVTRIQRLMLLRRTLQTADEQTRVTDAAEAALAGVPEQQQGELRGRLAAIRADISVRRVHESRRGGHPLPPDHPAVQEALSSIEASPSAEERVQLMGSLLAHVS